MAEALLALGANVGDVRATLERAVEHALRRRPVRLRARSSDYRTPPWGVEDQPEFVNYVIAVETELSPRALLERAQQIESALGRDRSRRSALGAAADRHRSPRLRRYRDRRAGLELPHPRLFERAFVLVPLAEIAPDRIIAGTTRARRTRRRRHHAGSRGCRRGSTNWCEARCRLVAGATHGIFVA